MFMTSRTHWAGLAPLLPTYCNVTSVVYCTAVRRRVENLEKCGLPAEGLFLWFSSPHKSVGSKTQLSELLVLWDVGGSYSFTHTIWLAEPKKLADGSPIMRLGATPVSASVSDDSRTRSQERARQLSLLLPPPLSAAVVTQQICRNIWVAFIGFPGSRTPRAVPCTASGACSTWASEAPRTRSQAGACWHGVRQRRPGK